MWKTGSNVKKEKRSLIARFALLGDLGVGYMVACM